MKTTKETNMTCGKAMGPFFDAGPRTRHCTLPRNHSGEHVAGTSQTPALALFDASIRLDRARRDVDIAQTHLHALVPTAPLRYGVAATAKLRAATAELAAAEQAYEAAQDQPAPTS